MALVDSDPLYFQPAPLVVDHPWDHAKSFFTTDGSVKYDKYIASGVSPPNRIVIEDVVEINRSPTDTAGTRPPGTERHRPLMGLG